MKRRRPASSPPRPLRGPHERQASRGGAPLTPDEIAAAKAVPLEELIGRTYTVVSLPHAPYARTREHDSLVISRRFNTYHWNSHGEEHGDAIDWIMRHANPGLSFRDAVQTLLQYPAAWRFAAVAEEKRPSSPGIRLDPGLAAMYHRQLSPAGYTWWAGRGVSRKLVDVLKLGEDQASYTIPIWNVFDNFQTLLNIRHRSRVKNAATRYLPECPGLGVQLYCPLPDVLKQPTIVWTSGEIKAMVLCANWIPAVTSTSGNMAWDPAWGMLLRDKRIVIAFDPGEENQAEIIQQRIRVSARNTSVEVVHLPGDPDDLLVEGRMTPDEMKKVLGL